MSLSEDKIILTKAFIEGINLSNIELFKIIQKHFEIVKPVFPLVEFILDRLSAVTDLAQQNRNWDAEIIYRSALEALIKFTYIVSAEMAERNQRLKEYWESLSDVNSIKLSEQAKKSLALYGDTEIMRLAFQPMVLPDILEQELREKWPRVKRKQLEQKWSFSEIIVSLAQTNEAFIGLAHNYRYASHVTHADETGVLIIKERSQRVEEERSVADLVHYIRLLSDSFFFCASMGLYTCKMTNENSKFFSDLSLSVNEATEIANKYLQKLQEDEMYDQYRKRER